MDWKLELVAVPVADVDRAKTFYTEKAGFNADHDHQVNEELRFVQLTPPGSACSIAIGTGLVDSEPGSARAFSSLFRRSRRARSSSGEVSWSAMWRNSPWGTFVFFQDPDGNAWSVQQIG